MIANKWKRNPSITKVDVDVSNVVEPDSYIGAERSLMVKAISTKRLQKERRLSLSELNALERESQTISVKQRKDALAKKVPEIEQELGELETDLKKLLASETAELNPSGKYYQMAEKLVGSP